MRTSKNIRYHISGSGNTVIPKGTAVFPADNLPLSLDDGLPRYWAEPWEGMSDDEASWERNYGFLIHPDEVE